MKLEVVPQGAEELGWKLVPKGLVESLIQHIAKVSKITVRTLRWRLRDGSLMQFDSAVFGAPVSMLVRMEKKENGQ